MSSPELPYANAWTSLVDDELEWARYQPFLEQHGYMLRPRYRPGWVSEMLTTGKGPRECEDSIPTWGGVLDATRIIDGVQVVLKMVETFSMDVFMAEHLKIYPDAHKHTVPILEVIQMPDNWQRAFMVMPRLRVCDNTPYFGTVREFAEFLQQVLEGLVYLHSKNIAHRDICPKNIVVDPSTIIPGRFHFSNPSTSNGVQWIPAYQADGPTCTTHFMKTRTQAGPMKYYYIDFGLSVRYSSFETRGLVTGPCGQRAKHIPEIFRPVPYDPFKVDVRSVGEMVRKDFLLEYSGLDCFIPFVQRLRRRRPASRPDAAGALALFHGLVSKMTEKQLEQPVWMCYSRKRKTLLFLKGLGLH
ncbi:kinase-like domain-containing protein [Mycena polygramma]|nr:kinase-like domain-containing protein [Mycena polygramma]